MKTRVFRVAWRGANVALMAAVIALMYSACWEYSVRRYLTGFTDAIIPANSTPERRVEAILSWMSSGPPRSSDPSLTHQSIRDPETTLNYRELLSVCGTATNAFLNLARSSGLQVRRLLLLTPDHGTKHVVAEVFLDGRWIVVDPTYRTVMRNSQGEMLTRKQLQDPVNFTAATAKIPGYPSEYSYEKFAHVRLARLPLDGLHMRGVLDGVLPGWDERIDWSLLLERESFFVFMTSCLTTLFLLALRMLLAWYADHRLMVKRFQLWSHIARAGAAFFTTPEIK